MKIDQSYRLLVKRVFSPNIAAVKPMLFRDVIGQVEVKHQLLEMVAQNRLSHALLFLAREGAGGLPLALAFSQYVSLLPLDQPQPGGMFEAEPRVLPTTPDEADAWMEKQPAFSKAQGFVHPDIHYTYPVVTKKSGSPPLSTDYITEWREFLGQLPYGNVFDWLQFINAENKQGNITAQECNDILRKLSLKSFENGYKVLVLWMPEYLGKEGNKLLKLIEEPPADTLFILVAENEADILSTILSRCQLVRIPSIESGAIAARLSKHSNCSPDQALQIANASNGSFREALNLVQHGEEDFNALLRDWLNGLLKAQPAALYKVLELLANLGREKQKQFLAQFIHLLEESIRWEAGGQVIQGMMRQQLSQAEQDFVAKMNKVMGLEQKEAICQELNDAIYFIERNAHGRMLFHALSIKLHYIVKNNLIPAP